EALLKEYPQLANQKAKIIKQFVAADGRTYNTFLVESDKPGFERFIAKSFVHNPDSLRREWMFLGLLQQHRAHAPRLLTPDHEPEHFLLMEHIDGIPASKALKQDYSLDAIFRGVGEATGMANSIELETYGNVLEPSNVTWKEFVQSSLDRKLLSVKPYVSDEFFAKVERTIAETRHILDEESKGKPMLVHHDIYLENFLVRNDDKRIVLIDYGIAYGGRPLFDLAKFFIWDLVHYPEQKDTFLKAYGHYVELPQNFNEIMKFYLLLECFGMIAYFDKIGAEKDRDDSLAVLKNLIEDTGAITELIG
ncbi:MAG TPA: aminoglycoside phosphotransferase family protein, partial [Candidatus Saccharimonadales bacterium]|nr:aminoglycoside phosphotransferase family protein [Candidatus Saccharimonadales bacterium]